MTQADRDPVEAGYDAVYAAMPHSPTLRRVWREYAAGVDFPDEFAHISFVTLPQLHRIASRLRLAPGDTLVDLGCGMGGPALWLARQAGANLVGVDLSPVAIAQATARATALELSSSARFVVGTFAATGLASGSADGIMSEDAIQYAPDKAEAFSEAARILRRGRRLMFTAFEFDDKAAAGLPIIGADPVGDYRPLLEAAGFEVELYEMVPGWPEPMASAYGAVLAAREALVQEMGEPAVAALSAEMTLTLERRPYKRRVLAVAART